MLGLLGLMGAVMAGLVLDSLFSGPSDAEGEVSTDHPDALTDSANDHGSDAGSILDWLDPPTDKNDEGEVVEGDPDETLPDSDDLPDEKDPDLLLPGTEGDDILQGSGGDDTIIGQDGTDQVLGRDGDDWIDAGRGDDHVTAGAGDDTIAGGLGDDDLHGDAGNDALTGGDGDDSLAGHEGNDSLEGGSGNDELLGGEGDDRLTDDQGDDWLAGGAGDDILAGGRGSDTLDGGSGDDTLAGHNEGAPDDGAVDYLNAGAGDDTLVLGQNDVATGDTGQDSFVLGDWLSGGGFAHIQDYNPDEDHIVLVYDPTAHPEPDLLLVRDHESDDVTVFFDGVPLAMVQNGAGLTPADIHLDPNGSTYPSAFHTTGAAA